jgi:protein-tyrosine phosphatase
MITEFQCHELVVGGGVLALSPLPGRTGEYAADLQRLLVWNPALVVTLCEEFELERKGAAGLGPDLAAHGIGWRHFPIPDYGVPVSGDSGPWAGISTTIHARLGRGEKVLLHCFGGCGRSGMAVLRVMIEVGEDGATALARLRQARPCAIETTEQLDWALGKVG